MADYVVGEADALAAVSPYVRGVHLTMHPGNRTELVNRAARETREGLWAILCVMGDGSDDETVTLARQHARRSDGAQTGSVMPESGLKDSPDWEIMEIT